MLLRPTSLALLAALALATPAATAFADSSSSPAPIAATRVERNALVAPVTQQAPVADPGAASTYAQREQQNQAPAKFEGGSVVIIGVSGGALIVILILLLLLV